MSFETLYLKSFNKIYKDIEKNDNYTEIDKSSNIQFYAEKVEILEYEKKIKSNDEKYIAAEIKDNYIGLLNQNLEREGIGYNIYSNNDIYIGRWLNNLRHSDGLYFYNQKQEKDFTNFEYYKGNWNGNTKHGFGVYVSIHEEIGNSSIESEKLSMKAFVGLFYSDNYNHGVYLEKIADEFYVYYGKFDAVGRKHDTKALIYDNKKDKVLRSRYDKGNLDSSYIVEFEGDSITKFLYLKCQSKALVSKKFIDKETITKVSEECSKFRDTMIDIDFFSKIYEEAKQTLKYKNNIKSLDDVNNEDGNIHIKLILSNKKLLDSFSALYKVMS